MSLNVSARTAGKQNLRREIYVISKAKCEEGRNRKPANGNLKVKVSIILFLQKEKLKDFWIC